MCSPVFTCHTEMKSAVPSALVGLAQAKRHPSSEKQRGRRNPRHLPLMSGVAENWEMCSPVSACQTETTPVDLTEEAMY